MGETLEPRLRHLLLALAFLFSFVSLSTAQEEVNLVVRVDTNEVFIGESITMQISVQNVQNGKPPNLEEMKEDFEIVLIGERPMSQSSMMVINGRMTQQNFYQTIYEYKLTPKRSGPLSIPSLSIEEKGKTYRSKSISIRVTEPEAQDIVLIETTLSKETVYPTQAFDITLKILVREAPTVEADPLRLLVRSPPHLTIPWIENPDGLRSPDGNRWLNRMLSDRDFGFALNNFSMPSTYLFGGQQLALFDLLTGKEERKGEDGQTYTYYRYEITKRFQADRPGVFQLGPSMVKGTFVVRFEDENFFGKKLAAISPQVQVVVKEVPSPRPETFIGGIGEYELIGGVSPSQCRVGDPLTLSLAVRSNTANLDLISPPDLRLIPELETGFEIVDPTPVGLVDGNEKRFSYSIRPKSVDAVIPQLKFDVFDPETERFVPIESPPLPLSIEESQGLNLGGIAAARAGADPASRIEEGGIFMGTHESHPIANEVPDFRLLGSAIAVSWIASLSAMGWIAFARVRSSRAGRYRKNDWGSTIRSRVAEAIQLSERGNDEEGMRAVYRTFADLIASQSTVVPESLTTEEILALAEESSLPPSLVGEIRRMLKAIDSSRFGSTQVDAKAHFVEAEKLMLEIADFVSSRHEGTKKFGAFGYRKEAFMLVVFLGLNLFGISSAAEQSSVAVDRGSGVSPEVELIDELQSAKKEEEFRRIAEGLDRLVHGGLRGGSIYFHLGNAWYRSGEIGKAIYAYRIASRFSPWDRQIRSNLQTAESKANTTGYRLFLPSYQSLVYLSIILGIISGPLLVLAVLRRSWRMGGLAIALLAFGLLSGGVARWNSPLRYAERMGVVTVETFPRAGMSDDSEGIGGEVWGIGTEVEILNQTSSWMLVRNHAGEKGWVRRDRVVGGVGAPTELFLFGLASWGHESSCKLSTQILAFARPEKSSLHDIEPWLVLSLITNYNVRINVPLLLLG